MILLVALNDIGFFSDLRAMSLACSASCDLCLKNGMLFAHERFFKILSYIV